MRQFSCRRFASGNAVRVAVTGELDVLTVPRLDRALRRAESDAESIILDLRELEFVDSSGAHLLLAADRRIREAKGRLVVVHAPYEVEWFFNLVGLDRELDFVDRPPAGTADRPPALYCAAKTGGEITDEEHEVVLHEEEVVIDKQTVPKERVRMDKDVLVDDEQVSEMVRKEQIEIDGASSRR
jgi:anti-anti-sigma factor